MKILVFDNYDSFTYNLVHMISKLSEIEVNVCKNDKVDLDSISNYDKIILSPGPGIPSEAGLLLQVIKHYAATKSILGVCLGHQAINEAFGGTLINLQTVYHGVCTPVQIESSEGKSLSRLFNGLETTIEVGRYHSWIVDEKSFPEELEITARDERGYIMALQHRTFDVQGVQFHPESILTPDGSKILQNWIFS